MSRSKIIHQWGVTMAKVKRAIEHLKKKKEMKVDLIPAYVPHEEFLERKTEAQNILAKMLIDAHKRGRPSKKNEEDFDYAA